MSRKPDRCRFDGKATYSGHGKAASVAARLPEPGRVYWCAHAGGWHITRASKVEYDRRRGGGVA